MEGCEDAIKDLGVDGVYLESQQQTDYEKNINEFLSQKKDLIVTVGFLLADATKAAAEANPDAKFAIINSPSSAKNVKGLLFDTSQPSFLAGYLAAGMSETGTVCTFGGINIPPVTDFMVGFQNGVDYYNTQKSADIQVLGWDNAKKDGMFTGNFESTDDGRRFAENLFDEGCDVIMPVAGPVGLGSAAAAKDRGLMMIGVDTDQFVSAPDFADVWLSSIQKNMDKAVFDSIKGLQDGTLTLGDNYTGTLANGGVGLAPFHTFDSKVPAELKTELDQVAKDIAAGKINTLTGEVKAAGPQLMIGQVTDTGGIDDKSFNATAWKGVQDAMKDLGVDGVYLESQQQTDYEKNINEFLSQKKDLIVTVGFLLADATKAAAEANPDAKFAIINSPSSAKNVKGLLFDTSQPSFLAGYLAAGMSETGTVCTFGGINIPPVTDFMVGFQNGVDYYNTQKSADIQVLGWDNAKKDGMFTGNFESTDDGRRFAENLFDEGCDVIMPVAGPVGLGSAAAAKDRGLMMIGVDTDQFVSAPDFADVWLSSIQKNMDKAVFDSIKGLQDGTLTLGDNYTGTLANGGVGLAPFHTFDSKVPAELKTELDQITKDIAAGKIDTLAAGS